LTGLRFLHSILMSYVK